MSLTAAAHPVRARGARWVASLFGLGHVPFAPGTVASLAALASGAALLQRGHAALAAGVLAASIAGLLATEWSGCGDGDPGWIVIDELAGQWLAMATLTHVSALGLTVAFALFRLLDIAKPGLIGVIDRRRGAAGVMGDDLLAGGVVAGALWIVQSVWPRVLG